MLADPIALKPDGPKALVDAAKKKIGGHAVFVAGIWPHGPWRINCAALDSIRPRVATLQLGNPDTVRLGAIVVAANEAASKRIQSRAEAMATPLKEGSPWFLAHHTDLLSLLLEAAAEEGLAVTTWPQWVARVEDHVRKAMG